MEREQGRVRRAWNRAKHAAEAKESQQFAPSSLPDFLPALLSSIDAGSITTFDESVQRMRNALPYNRALLFVLVLKDLRARSAPAAYRERLNGLSYKEIARLASPAVTTEYLALYGGNAAGALSSGGNEGIGAPPFYDHP